MKKKLLNSMRVLLVAAGLCVGQSAWATIDLPTGYEITKAYIGTLSAGVITPETFDDYVIGSEWSIAKASETSIASTLTITDVTEIAKPAVNGSVETGVIPTYVSGKTLTGTIPSTSKSWIQHRFTYDLGETLTDGYIVLSADMFNEGANKTTPERLYILDEDDNIILQFYFKGGSSQQLFQIAENGVVRSWSGVQSASRSDTGFGIKDLTINIAAGTGSFTLDYIHTASTGRSRKTASTTVNFGTGHNIRKIAFGREEYDANPELTYLDNVELYRLEPAASSHSWAIKANCAGNLVTLASGMAEADEDYQVTGLPKVVKTGGSFYVLNDNSVTNYCTETYTMGDDDETQEITYTLASDIVYYAEGEDFGGSNTSGTSYSGGAYCNYFANPNSNSTVAITSTGAYKLETNVIGREDASVIGVYPSDGTTPIAQIERNGSTGERYCTFNANSGTTLRIGGNYYSDKFQNSLSFDYIIIRKVADIIDAGNEFVGEFDNSTADLGAMTNKVTLKPGEAYHYNFVNHGLSGDNSYNWVLPVYDSTDALQLKLRADRYDTEGGRGWTGWETGGAWNWETFQSEMDGATVDMNIAYSAANVFTMNCTITTASSETWTLSYNSSTAGATLSGNIKVALSVNKAWLEVTAKEQTAVSVTIPTSGFATLATAYGLDFSGVTGLSAYVANSATAESVKLTSVTEIPANSAVILEGTANAVYTIPVKAAATYDGTNLLQAAVTATDIDANTAYILQDGEFHLVTEASTVPAGKAYLLAANVPSGARALAFNFGGETSISSIEAVKQNGEVYNLKGQRIAQPTKGLYIVNGKKVVVK